MSGATFTLERCHVHPCASASTGKPRERSPTGVCILNLAPIVMRCNGPSCAVAGPRALKRPCMAHLPPLRSRLVDGFAPKHHNAVSGTLPFSNAAVHLAHRNIEDYRAPQAPPASRRSQRRNRAPGTLSQWCILNVAPYHRIAIRTVACSITLGSSHHGAAPYQPMSGPELPRHLVMDLRVSSSSHDTVEPRLTILSRFSIAMLGWDACTQDERFSATISTSLLRPGRLRKCLTYQRVCLELFATARTSRSWHISFTRTAHLGF
jgi:hypothetical protein